MYKNHTNHVVKREQAILFYDGLLSCKSCHNIKPINNFSKSTGYSLGYSYICKDCNKKSRLTNSCSDCGKPCGKVNKRSYCIKCFTKRNAEFRDYSDVTGENNHMWKGGKFMCKGYLMLSIKGRRVAEHIYIIENEIGRKLTKDECIHHIDMDKLNNDKSNLMLMTKSKHRKLHHAYELYTANLIKSGVITLNEVIT